MPSPTEAYLEDLRRQLRGNPLLARRVLEEVTDHLAEATAAARRSGMSQQDAEQDAIHRFGAPGALVSELDRFGLPLKLLVLGASVATVGVGLWLLWVIAFILPVRDPAHIPMWRAVAFAFFSYSLLCGSYLVVGPRNPVLRWAVTAASLTAIAVGLGAVVDMIRMGMAGGHFEGYIVLMGLILAGHGLSAVVYTLLAQRIHRQVRARA